MSEREGGCQCGRVRYRVVGDPIALVACHCKECQRQSGSAFGMSLIVPQASFTVAGELKMFERRADSGRTLRCFFCPECGTRIYHQPGYAAGVVNVKAGTLDDTASLGPQLHTWVDAKQQWTIIPEGVPTHPTQPV
jgi:hypothetical protein